MTNGNIIYFGSGSYKHLKKTELDKLYEVREVMLNLIDKKGNCNITEVRKKLTSIKNRQTIRHLIFMLCSGTLELGKKPEFIMKTKLPHKHPKYKITTVIHRQGGRTI